MIFTRSKRALAEADPNAEIKISKAKKGNTKVASSDKKSNANSVSKPQGKENEQSFGRSKKSSDKKGKAGSNVKTSNDKEPSCVTAGSAEADSEKVNVGETKFRAAAIVVETATADKAAGKASKKARNPSTDMVKATSEGAKAKPEQCKRSADMWEWITACRPVFDIENEDNEKRNEDESEGEHEEQSDDRYTCSTEETCKCMKPAELSPEWTWVFTKDGYKSYELWLNEQLKRDQDEWGLYICNDFSGYGVLEVMENQLMKFNQEYKKKSPNVMTIWPIIEGMALFLNGDLMQWGMCDDGERLAVIPVLFGTAVLSVVDLLIKQKYFHSDSEIKNIGLVLALFIQFAIESSARVCEDSPGDCHWTHQLIKTAECHGVKIAGPFGIEKEIQEAKDEMNSASDSDDDEDPDEENERSWKQWDWAREYKEYARNYGGGGRIGGSHYDITKMSQRERKAYELGNLDHGAASEWW